MKKRFLCIIVSVCVLFLSSCGLVTEQPSFNDAVIIENESEISNPEESSEESLEEPESTIPAEEFSEEEDTSSIVLDEDQTTTGATQLEQYPMELTPSAFSINSIPSFTNKPYVEVNNNVPYFTSSDYTNQSYEYYSEFDSLGRCGTAVACIGQDLMPTEERGSIGQVRPTGWHLVKYDNVDGKYLYNRCHLIGYQLSGENTNVRNLITGTRYLNMQGMLPFENTVAGYVTETNNHVLYRVTPVFEGNNLLATGVLMEGYSIEDDGEGVCYCVFAYNAQPGIDIDYATGDSSASITATEATTKAATTKAATTKAASTNPNTTSSVSDGAGTYVLNTNTMKFHYPSCKSVGQMSEKNKQNYTGSREELIKQGYSPCGRCNP